MCRQQNPLFDPPPRALDWTNGLVKWIHEEKMVHQGHLDPFSTKKMPKKAWKKGGKVQHWPWVSQPPTAARERCYVASIKPPWGMQKDWGRSVALVACQRLQFFILTAICTLFIVKGL